MVWWTCEGTGHSIISCQVFMCAPEVKSIINLWYLGKYICYLYGYLIFVFWEKIHSYIVFWDGRVLNHLYCIAFILFLYFLSVALLGLRFILWHCVWVKKNRGRSSCYRVSWETDYQSIWLLLGHWDKLREALKKLTDTLAGWGPGRQPCYITTS